MFGLTILGMQYALTLVCILYLFEWSGLTRPSSIASANSLHLYTLRNNIRSSDIVSPSTRTTSKKAIIIQSGLFSTIQTNAQTNSIKTIQAKATVPARFKFFRISFLLSFILATAFSWANLLSSMRFLTLVYRSPCPCIRHMSLNCLSKFSNCLFADSIARASLYDIAPALERSTSLYFSLASPHFPTNYCRLPAWPADSLIVFSPSFNAFNAERTAATSPIIVKP